VTIRCNLQVAIVSDSSSPSVPFVTWVCGASLPIIVCLYSRKISYSEALLLLRFVNHIIYFTLWRTRTAWNSLHSDNHLLHCSPYITMHAIAEMSSTLPSAWDEINLYCCRDIPTTYCRRRIESRTIVIDLRQRTFSRVRFVTVKRFNNTGLIQCSFRSIEGGAHTRPHHRQ
jgi:hypothetical protein